MHMNTFPNYDDIGPVYKTSLVLTKSLSDHRTTFRYQKIGVDRAKAGPARARTTVQ